MIGFMASFKVYPHLVGNSGLRVRNGTFHDITVPWEAIETIVLRERTLDRSRTLQVEKTEQAAVLSVVVASRTNVDVTLGRPLAVPLRKGTESVTELRLYVDDARGLVGRVRERRLKRS
jgi:hypothetical protein